MRIIIYKIGCRKDLMKKHKSLRLFYFLVLFVTTISCLSEKSDKPTHAKLSKKQQEKLDEYTIEVEVGRNLAGRLLAFYGLYGDRNLRGYINQVGNYVADYSDHPDRRYMFNVLDTDTINAFACPGGYILLTLGSLRNAHSEAELAMILGHEIAHVGKKHMLQTIATMKKKEHEKAIKKVDGTRLNPLSIIVRKRPSGEKSQAGDLLARYMSGASGAGLSILGAVKTGMNLMLEQGLDKEFEYEADQEGVKYAIFAGYEPKALNKFLTRLEKSKGKKTKVIERTHPSVKSRKKRIKKLLKSMMAVEIVGAKGKKRYNKIRKALRPPKKP